MCRFILLNSEEKFYKYTCIPGVSNIWINFQFAASDFDIDFLPGCSVK